jgi:hypothetical protein
MVTGSLSRLRIITKGKTFDFFLQMRQQTMTFPYTVPYRCVVGRIIDIRLYNGAVLRKRCKSSRPSDTATLLSETNNFSKFSALIFDIYLQRITPAFAKQYGSSV